MTAPVNASIFLYLKKCANLGGKSDPIEQVFFFLFTWNTGAGGLFHTKNAIIPPYEFCWLFHSLVCMLALQHLAAQWH